MNALKHNLKISRGSWHARWFEYWKDLTGNYYAKRENFCHYMEVLFVFAPLAWFFRAKLNTVVRPWSVTFMVGICAFVSLAFYVWPHEALKVLEKLGLSIGYCVGVVTLFVLVFSLAGVLENHEKLVLRSFLVVTFVIWILPYLIYRVVAPFVRSHKRQLKAAVRWYFGRRYVWYITPFWATVSAGIGAIAYFVPFVLLYIGAVVVILAVIIAVIIGIIALVELNKARRWSKAPEDSSSHRVRRAYEPVADTVKLVATAVGNKKRGSAICPFIDFVD